MKAETVARGRRAVFLDRDGTLIEEVGYLDRLDRVTLYPWSIDAVRLLRQAGFAVVVVTNQAGVARGYFEESFVHTVHRDLAARFAAGNAPIDGWYYCPHHRDGVVERYRIACDCRKPKAGMVRQAADDLSIDLARSIVVGDRWLDVQMGQAVGATGLLVRTGFGASEETRPVASVQAAAVTANLMEAVSWILRHDP